jgi:hypothetical protein
LGLVNATSRERSRTDGAQRWASILVGMTVVALVGFMTYESSMPRAAGAHGADAAAPVASANAAKASPATGDAGATAMAMEDVDGGLYLPSLSLGDAGASAVMPSGAPRHVKIGVVLVSFAGAEGAPPNARSKKDAQAIADRLGADARSDFHHAVTGGDQGSADDIGRLPRGVLDPRTEVAVFGLAPGEISDVLETPRGYWIVKRIE